MSEHRQELPKISAILVNDTGSGRIVTVGVHENYDDIGALQEILAPVSSQLHLLEPKLSRTFGSDYAPFNAVGVPGFSCIGDAPDYSETQHTQSDTFDKGSEAGLIQSAQLMAVWAFNTAQYPSLLPRRAGKSSRHFERILDHWGDVRLQLLGLWINSVPTGIRKSSNEGQASRPSSELRWRDARPPSFCGLLISGMNKRSLLLCACAALAAATIIAATPQDSHSKSDPSTEAARLNNLGAAYMNQQLFEKGLKAFQEASALDPKLQIASLNQGIALLNLARIEPAKGLLEAAGKNSPNDPHAWFSLGLLYKNSDNPQGSVDAFRRVTEIDPNDADSWYFLGAASAQLKQYPQAIDAFQHALKINPLHASAEFGIARAHQQSGDATQAREHLVRFQHITQSKLGSPIGLAYGDQGKYSLVEEAVGAAEKALPPVPVRFVPVAESAGLASKPSSGSAANLAAFLGPGACFLDYDGDGKQDIFLPDNGPQGGMALYHNAGTGKFEDVTKKAGLDPSIHAIGCTAGDYDNDGAADLAVSMKDRILLLHNEKNGTFKDVTDAAGIKSPGVNLGLTFIDYDHDGDLDLYITRYSDAGQYDPRLRNAFNAGVTSTGASICGATTATELSPRSPIPSAFRDRRRA